MHPRPVREIGEGSNSNKGKRIVFEYSSELLALHKLANQRIAEQVLIYT